MTCEDYDEGLLYLPRSCLLKETYGKSICQATGMLLRKAVMTH